MTDVCEMLLNQAKRCSTAEELARFANEHHAEYLLLADSEGFRLVTRKDLKEVAFVSDTRAPAIAMEWLESRMPWNQTRAAAEAAETTEEE